MASRKKKAGQVTITIGGHEVNFPEASFELGLDLGLARWKKEYMGADLDKMDELRPSEIIEIALWKWIGLQKHILEEHGIERQANVLVRKEERLAMVIDNCALCVEYYAVKKFKPDCTNCPIYKKTGGSCFEAEDSPYRIWANNGDAGPMIELLAEIMDDALEEEEGLDDDSAFLFVVPNGHTYADAESIKDFFMANHQEVTIKPREPGHVDFIFLNPCEMYSEKIKRRRIIEYYEKTQKPCIFKVRYLDLKTMEIPENA